MTLAWLILAAVAWAAGLWAWFAVVAYQATNGDDAK